MSGIFQRYLEAIQYKITGGEAHGWRCYPNARYFDSITDGVEISCLADPLTDTVYEITAARAGYSSTIYRWRNPLWLPAHDAEAESRGINANQAFDDVEYADTESFEDIMTKLTDIVAGREPDPRVVVSFELDDDILMDLFMEAHRRDITANALLTEILEAAIDASGVMDTDEKLELSQDAINHAVRDWLQVG